MCMGIIAFAQPGFDRTAPFTTLESASFVFGDIDGDGDEDVLMMGAISNDGYYSQLYTYDHPTGYTLVESTPFPGVINGAAAFADIDGDHDLDLFIVGATGEAGSTTPAPSISSFYLNDGNGQFTLDPDNNLPGRISSEVAFADFDRDNDLDLIVTGYESVTATAFNPEFILYENIDGVFTNANGSNPFSQTASNFDIGDINGDTYLDIVAAGKSTTASPVKIYLNQGGSLTFTEGTSPISLGAAFVKLANINSDQNLELLVTGQTNSDFSNPVVYAALYNNNGAGVFSEVPNDPIVDVFLANADFGDLDADGDLDLIVAGTAYNTTYERTTKHYENNNGIFSEASLSGLVAGYGAGQVSIIDINNDGDMDYFQTGVNDTGTSRAILLNTYNDQPQFVGAFAASFEENLTSVALDADANDGDGGETDQSLTYAITGNGADDALFIIDSETGEVTFKNSPDFESPADANADNSYELNISIFDGKTIVDANFTISVTDGDDAPIITSATAATFDENATGAAYTAVAEDMESAVVYTLTSGGDNDLFTIDDNSGEVSFVSAPNFESPADANGDNTYEIEITATDISNNTDVINLSISVNDVLETPLAIFLDNTEIGSGNNVGDIVGTLTFDSPDADPQVSFELPGGYGDNASFTIDTDKLKAAVVFDVNTKSSYDLQIRAYNANGNELFETFTITVVSSVFDPNALIVTNNNDSGTGSLREAIVNAELNPGADIINIGSGVGTITLASQLPDITQDLEIKGAGKYTTIIDGDNAVRPFLILTGIVTISDLTIQNGLGKGGDTYGGGGGAGMGGAIYIDDAVVTIENVSFSGNQALGGSSNVGSHDGGDGPLPGLGGAEGETINNFTTGLPGGDGGFGAGGGRGGFGTQGAGRGGNGGYGAGGGGGENDPFGGEPGGSGGSFGGRGGSNGAAGGAGAGLGGAIFMRNGTLSVNHSDFNNNEATAGTPGSGGGAAQSKAGAIFNMAGTFSTYKVSYSNNSAGNAGSTDSDNENIYGNISVLNDLVIEQQPVDQTGLTEGVSLELGVKTSGSVSAYQWQVNDGSGWVEVTDTEPYSGATTDTLSISCLLASMDGLSFRCQIDGVLNDLTTNEVSLGVSALPIMELSLTGNVEVGCVSGETKIYTATVTNAVGTPTYTWYLNDTEITGETSNELTTLVVTDDVVSVTVNDPGVCFDRSLTESVTIIAGPPTVPTVTIEQLSPYCGGVETYTQFGFSHTNAGDNPRIDHWEVNGDWVSLYDEGLYDLREGDVVKVFLEVDDSYSCVAQGTVVTDEFVVSIGEQAVIDFIAHPQDVDATYTEGSSISFSVSAEGADLIYTWEYYDIWDEAWSSDVSGLGTTVTGQGTPNLNIDEVSNWLGGMKIRCSVGEGLLCPQPSEEATINFKYGTITITNTSNDKTVEGSLPWAADQTKYLRPYNGVVTFDAMGISGTIDLQETLSFFPQAILKGPGSENLTITSSSGINVLINSRTELYGAITPLTIEGISVSGGSTYGIASSDDLTLVDVQISNSGYWGLSVSGGTIVLNDVHISNCNYEAFQLSCSSCTGVEARIQNSSFTTSPIGLNLSTSHNVFIENSLFKDNTNDGLYVNYTLGTNIYGSSFINNRNGIRINNGNTTIERSTFSGNSNMGVHILDEGYTFDVVVNSSTIANNQYGISNDFGELLPDVNNSIIVGNTQKDIYGSITSSIGYLAYEKPYNASSLSGVTEYNIVAPISTLIDENLTTDGILMYHEPASCSPVIDAGSTDLTTDQLGDPIVGLPDIGAIELQSGLSPVTVSATINQVSSDICPGEEATFTATPINGGDAPSYQWMINGENAGTDSDTFVTSALQEGDEITVAVTSNSTCQLVENPGVSDPLAVSFSGLPEITQQPVDQSITSSQQATFTATGSGADLTYQWQVNDGSSWVDIADGGIYAGVATNTLTITGAGYTESGNQYRAKVTENCPAYSDPATLTVQLEFVVTTVNDVKDANDGETSLREAMELAWNSNYWAKNGNITADAPIIIDATAISGTMEISSVLPDVYAYLKIIGPSDQSLIIKAATGANVHHFSVGNSNLVGGLTLENIVLRDAVFSGNGGAVTIDKNSLFSAKNCVFENNQGANGGAIWAANTSGANTINLEGCSFIGNIASPGGNGGAIYLNNDGNGILNITNSAFIDNNGTYGGGVAAFNATSTVVNTTISGNVSSNLKGAGLLLASNKANKVINCTIVNNTSPQGSGGIDFSASVSTAQILENNIIIGNSGNQVTVNGYVTGSRNILGTQSSTFGSDNLYAIPIEEVIETTLSDNGGPTLTYNLAACSYALDFVIDPTDNTPELDARGVARIGATDAGALEFNGTRDTSGGTPELTITASQEGVCGTETVTFTATDNADYTYSWFVDDIEQTETSNVLTADVAVGQVVKATIVSSARCLVTNIVSTELTIIQDTEITTPPELMITASQDGVCGTGTVTFTATENVDYTYSWFVDGVDKGEGTNSFTSNVSVGQVVNATIVSNARCLVTNTVSEEMTIATGAVATVDSQPTDQVIDPNGSTSFSVEATGANLTFQWQQQTVTGEWKDLPADVVADNLTYSGEQTATLTISEAMVIGASRDPYIFRCAVAEVCAVYSESAEITFSSFPSGVVTNGNNDGPGSLRQALLDVQYLSGNDNQPYVIDATTITDNIQLTENLPVLNGLHAVINTPADSKLALVNLDNIDGLRFFELTNGASLTIDGVSFTGGKGENGGAISVDNSNLQLTNAIFNSNAASGNGGVIYANNATVTIDSSSFERNTASIGAVIYSENGTFNLHRSNLYYNGADTAGSIYAVGTSYEIDSVTLDYQYASNVASIYLDNSTIGSSILNNLRIIENEANDGGALHLIGDVTFRNSLVYYSYSYGTNAPGAVILESGVEFYNSTLYGNGASAVLLKGGDVKMWNLSFNRSDDYGIFVEDGSNYSISNSIIDGIKGTIGSEYGHNLYYETGEEVLEGNTEGNIVVNSSDYRDVHAGYLINGDGNYLDVPPCSDAINSGITIPGSELDQIGQARVGEPEIGAVEFYGETLTPGQFTFELVASHDDLTVCGDEMIDVTFTMNTSPGAETGYLDYYEYEWRLNGNWVDADVANPVLTLTGMKAGDELEAYVYAEGSKCLNDDYGEATVSVTGLQNSDIQGNPVLNAVVGEEYVYPFYVGGESGVTVTATDGTALPDWLSISENTTPGVLSSIAGSTEGNVDGTGADAQFKWSMRMARDSEGNLYVVDRLNSAIRKIDQNGTVSTITSTLGSGSGYGIVVDGNDEIYYADAGAYVIGKLNASGTPEVYAGNGISYNRTGDLANVGFRYPFDVKFGPDGAMYVADYSANYIMKYADGMFTRLAYVSSPSGIAIDAQNNVYVSSYNVIYKIDSDGNSSVFVGSGSYGLADGKGREASFDGPQGMAFDAYGNLIVADRNNHAIRRVTPDGVVTTLAGGTAGDATGPATDAVFKSPEDVVIDPQTGNIIVADAGNYKIKVLTAAGDFVLTGAPDQAGDFNISLTASSGTCNDDTQSFTISITESDPPVFVTESNVSFDENQTLLNLEIQDASPFTIAITGGSDAALFEIQSGDVAFINTPNFEVPHDSDFDNIYELEITATDAGDRQSVRMFYVDVADANDNPDNISLDNSTVDEFMPAGSLVGVLSATDEDAGDEVVFSLESGTAENDFFYIEDNQLLTKQPFDFDLKSSYILFITATDLYGGISDQKARITINEVTNVAPWFVQVERIELMEDEFFFFTPQVVDRDGDALTVTATQLPDWVTFETYPDSVNYIYEFQRVIEIDENNSYYGITDDNVMYAPFGGTPESLFEPGVISNPPYSGASLAVTPDGTLFVTSGDSIMKYSNGQLTTFYNEGSPNNMAYHPDGYLVFGMQNADFTFTLKKATMDGTVTDIVANMPWDGGTLTVRGNGDIVVPDLENNLTTYTIDGQAGQPIILDIELWDYSDAGVTTPGLYSFIDLAFDKEDNLYVLYTEADGNSNLIDVLVKNTPDGVTELWRSEDAYEAVSLAIDVNGDPSIVASGFIQIIKKNNYILYGEPGAANIGSHPVTLRAEDGTTFTEQTFTIEVGYYNDAPTDLEISGTAIEENNDVETNLFTFTTVDPDAGYDSFTYELVTGEGDNNNNAFKILDDGLQAIESFDYEVVGGTLTIRVKTTDAKGETFEKSFDISVNDVNDVPSDILLSNTSVDEGQLPGATVGQFTTEDQDSDVPFTYALVGASNDNDLFVIEGNILKTKQVLDYSEFASVTIRVSTTDDQGASFEKDITIQINEVSNSLPVLTNAPAATTTVEEVYTYEPMTFDFEGSTVSITATLPDWLLEKSVSASISEVITPNASSNLEIDANGNIYTLVEENYSVVNIEKMDATSGTITTLLTENANSIPFVDVDESGNVFYADNTSYGSYPIYQLGDATPIHYASGDITAGGYHSDGFIVYAETQADYTYDMKKVSLADQSVTTLKEDVGYVAVFDIGADGNIHYSGSNVMSAIDIDGNVVSSIVLQTPTSNASGSYLYYITDVAVYDDGMAYVMFGEADGQGGLADVLVKVTPGGEEELWRGTQIYEAGKIAANSAESVYFLRDETASGSKGVWSYKAGYTYYEGTPAVEDAGNYTLSFTLNDGTADNTFDFDLTVYGNNEVPTAISLSQTDIDENAPLSTVIGTLSATDADVNDEHVFSLVNGFGDNASFDISGDQLSTVEVFDYETKSSYSIKVHVDDQNGGMYEEELTIIVNDRNDVPTAIVLSAIEIDENAAAGTLIGTLSATDQDATDSHTFSLVAGFGDNASFEISGGDITNVEAFDFEIKSSYSIKVLADDQNGGTFEQELNITVNDVNDAPSMIALTANTIDENADVGTLIGLISATDEDAADSHIFSLIDGFGDNASFTISGVEISNAEAFDFETKSSYSIKVLADDQNGGTFEQEFTISVNDVNDAPTMIALSANTIDENAEAGTVIGSLSATDEDVADSHVFSLVAGFGDNASFTISGSELSNAEVFNYETKSSYRIKVIVDDQNGGSFEQELTITINNVNDAPTALAISSSSIDENAPVGTLITALFVRDDDAADSHTFSLVAGYGDNASFAISGNELSNAEVFDFETKSSYHIKLLADDQNGGTLESELTITVEDVNDAPHDIMLSNNRLDEDAAPGSLIGTLSTIDQDAGDTHTYEVLTTLIIDDIEITPVMAQGADLVTAIPLDFEYVPELTIEVKSTDQDGLSFIKSFTLFANDVNEAPYEIELSATSIDENSVIGTVIGVLTALDDDLNDSFTYSLVAGFGDNASFTISGDELTNAKVFDFEAKSSYSIKVLAADQGGLTVEQEFTITVNDLDERLDQTITFEALADKTFGDAMFTLNATVTSGLAVTYTSSDVSILTIVGSNATIIGAGEVTITASQQGNDDYFEAEAVSQLLKINKASQTITFDLIGDQQLGVAPITLSATASSGLAINYEVSGPATISDNLLTITGDGEVVVTATQSGNANYLAAEAVTQTFTVTDPAKSDQTITFDLPSSVYVTDSPVTLTASSTSGLDVSFEIVGGESLVSLSGDQLTLMGAGSVEIRAFNDGNDDFNKAEVVMTLEIKPVFTVSGVVTDENGDAFSAGLVVIVLKGTTTPTTTTLNTDGSYEFSDLKDGVYYLGVQPTDVASYYTTAYGDVITYQDATPITLTEDASGINIQMVAKPTDNELTGDGVITGRVISSEVGSGNRIVMGAILEGDAIEGASIFLQRKADSKILTEVFSDANGDFKISGVPVGSFSLIINIPGIEGDIATDINVTEDEEILMTAAVSEDGISFETEVVEILSIDEAIWRAYPNPVIDYVEIEVNEGMQSFSWELMDMRGVRLSSGTVDGQNHVKIDMSQLGNALYFVRVQDDQGHFRMFKIQK